MANAEWMLTPEEIRAIPFYKNTPDEALPYELIKAEAKKMLEWLSSKARYMDGPFMAHFPEDANMVVFDKDKLDWQTLRKEVLGE